MDGREAWESISILKDSRVVGFWMFLPFVDAPRPPQPETFHVVYVEAVLANVSVSPKAKSVGYQGQNLGTNSSPSAGIDPGLVGVRSRGVTRDVS